MSTLHLAVKRIYFEQIKSGEKPEEYRLVTPYWKKRLVGRTYTHVQITLGYPKAGDPERTLIFPYTGYRATRLTHPHFGPDEVSVYAIALKHTERVLTEAAQAERDAFKAIYGRDGNCNCHRSPPCSSCTHPGNPMNQEEDDECWIAS